MVFRNSSSVASGIADCRTASGRLSAGRRGDKALSEIAIPDDLRIGWSVEEEFVSAIRGTETITRTTFEDGVRYMEFTDAVTKSAASGQSVEVAAL